MSTESRLARINEILTRKQPNLQVMVERKEAWIFRDTILRPSKSIISLEFREGVINL